VIGYEALRTSAAAVDLSARGKLKITGEDRARLLHAMTTNHIQEMQPGDCRYAFFLNAQGRILADAWILCADDHMLVITEPETRQKVFDHLDQYIIADDAQVEDVTETWKLISLEGPEAETRDLPFTATGLPGGAFLAESVPQGLPEFADAEAVRTVRIENGRPRFGEELTDRFLVQETGQLQGVHFSKGCYLGQEIVERVRSRGQVHRHLRGVRIEGEAVPEVGAKFVFGDKEVGELVSAAYSPALGKVVGMAYLRTDAANPGMAVSIDGRGAQVVSV
jgi:tRNA-modifying protein YgfZ